MNSIACVIRRIKPESAPRLSLSLVLLALTAGGCSTVPQQPSTNSAALPSAAALRILDRITWGTNASTAREVSERGIDRYLAAQLKPDAANARLPEPVEAQIAAMTITQRPLVPLVVALEQQRKDGDANKIDDQQQRRGGDANMIDDKQQRKDGDASKIDDKQQRKGGDANKIDDKQAARQAYRQELTRLGREASTRSLLRAVYSRNQLQEQMTWFWFDHFNVNQNKGILRALIGDYEDRAIRPHALGRFRDLLQAVVHHPAMLLYLDNARNASGRINENFARELMELHTLGADGGYTQRDVQELARVLTGVGVNLGPNIPNVRPRLQSQYVRDGLFEFNPNRHDYGDKELLGLRLRGEGLQEVDAALDRLARHPSTARFVSRKLATYFVADDPPAALVERMAREFERSDGDIAATLSTLFAAPEFTASLGGKFKDPMHYVVSAVRLAYDDKPILNAGPMLYWLNRMAEPLHGRQTPDGYPLTSGAWTSSGQMATRFEIARAIGMGSAGLFRVEDANAGERAPPPQLSNALFHEHLQPRLSQPTRAALEQAGSPQEWNVFLLASPEFMNR
ncbi:MAG: DUF1800 domain-containing protein [Betaproteobacteria bacterium]